MRRKVALVPSFHQRGVHRLNGILGAHAGGIVQGRGAPPDPGQPSRHAHVVQGIRKPVLSQPHPAACVIDLPTRQQPAGLPRARHGFVQQAGSRAQVALLKAQHPQVAIGALDAPEAIEFPDAVGFQQGKLGWPQILALQVLLAQIVPAQRVHLGVVGAIGGGDPFLKQFSGFRHALLQRAHGSQVDQQLG